MTTPKSIRRWLKRNNPEYRLVRTEYLTNLQDENRSLTLALDAVRAERDDLVLVAEAWRDTARTIADDGDETP